MICDEPREAKKPPVSKPPPSTSLDLSAPALLDGLWASMREWDINTLYFIRPRLAIANGFHSWIWGAASFKAVDPLIVIP